MVKVDINDADKKIFQTEIFNQLHPIVMRKMDALRLKSFGLENSLICQILKIHPNQKKEQQFLDTSLFPRIAEAKSGNRCLYYCDAAHFVCGSFLGYLWCIVKVLIPSLSGRSRYNVLAAIDAITFDFTYICNETYITATTVCELLRQLKLKHLDDIPITIVLDNAKYQCCKLVKDLALELGIELLFLPSYSPNLNIIPERELGCIKNITKSKIPDLQKPQSMTEESIIFFDMGIC